MNYPVSFGISSRRGLPCRAEDCAHISEVLDGSTMASLHLASDERREHERSVHGLDIPQVEVDPGRRWVSTPMRR